MMDVRTHPGHRADPCPDAVPGHLQISDGSLAYLPGLEGTAPQRHGELEIRPEAGQAILRSQELSLTPTEFRLVTWLASHPGRLFDYCTLAERVLGYDCSRSEAREILRVHVMNLRRKLGDDPRHPRYIVCVRGIGYRFASARPE